MRKKKWHSKCLNIQIYNKFLHLRINCDTQILTVGYTMLITNHWIRIVMTRSQRSLLWITYMSCSIISLHALDPNTQKRIKIQHLVWRKRLWFKRISVTKSCHLKRRSWRLRVEDDAVLKYSKMIAKPWLLENNKLHVWPKPKSLMWRDTLTKMETSFWISWSSTIHTLRRRKS